MKIWRKILFFTGVAVLAMSSTAFAGTWKENQTGWYWEETDGTYPASTWKWLDGNHDGVAECYYFNHDGYLATDITTPDGYRVDADGRWVVNGDVQTQGHNLTDPAGAYAAALNKSNELNSFAARASVDMKMSSGAESYDMKFDMDMKVKDLQTSNIKYLANVNMSMLGENMTATMFYIDGYSYMDMLGSKIKVATPLDEIVKTTKSVSGGMMQELEYLQDIQMSTDETGNKIFTFTCKTDSMNAMLGQLLEGQMGVSDVNNMKIGEYRGTVVVNTDGYITACDMIMTMKATVMDVPFLYELKLRLDYVNPGQPVDFALPSTQGYTSAG